MCFFDRAEKPITAVNRTPAPGNTLSMQGITSIWPLNQPLLNALLSVQHYPDPVRSKEASQLPTALDLVFMSLHSNSSLCKSNWASKDWRSKPSINTNQCSNRRSKDLLNQLLLHQGQGHTRHLQERKKSLLYLLGNKEKTDIKH